MDFSTINIRIKFIFLIVGVTLIPFLVVSIIFFFQMTDTPFRTTYGRYLKSKHWIEKNLSRAQLGDPVLFLKDVSDTRPRGLEIVFIGDNDRILFSTIESFSRGGKTTPNEVFTLIRDSSSDYEFQLIPYQSSGKSGIFLVMTPRLNPVADRNLKNIFNNLRFYTVLAVPIVLIIFTSLMSFYIIKSIRNQIDTLENATRRIANGDLNFNFSIKGKDELASLARSFDAMRKKLKEEYSKRARLIMGISHDLKTPLASIEGYSDAIMDGYADNPEKLKDYVSIIKEKSLLLEQRIGRLIDFVRLETGEWKLMHTKVVLKDFIENFARRYSEDAKLIGFDFKYRIEIPAGTVVSMDKDLFLRVLENLSSNAIRYSKGKSDIFFQAVREGKRILISISNFTSEFKKDEIEQIFEPFYRGSPSRREEGLGLGLTTVKSIVDAHGWDIEARCLNEKSDISRLTFTITINLK